MKLLSATRGRERLVARNLEELVLFQLFGARKKGGVCRVMELVLQTDLVL
jgi:hypothetical protein